MLAGAYLLGLKDLRRAIAARLAPSTRKAWISAANATAIHVGTALLLVLPDPAKVWVLRLNLILSAIPALDGWSQEVLFRGLCAVGESAWEVLSPLIGTFILGCFYACAVRSGRGRLALLICARC